MNIKDKYIGKFYASLFVGFIIVVIIGSILQNYKLNNHIKVRDENELHGVLAKVSPERSGAYCVLKDGRKVFISDSDNLNYEPYAINEFLKRGDSIVKPLYTDTLFIFREREKYFFVLGKRIGKEKE